MPILDVQIIGPVADEVRHGLARRIAEATAAVFQSRPHGTWVKVQFVVEDTYAENGGGPPPGAHPVIASVLHAEPPQGDALVEQVARLTRAIAETCGRPPENVHLIYEASARGRVSFGGRLVR